MNSRIVFSILISIVLVSCSKPEGSLDEKDKEIHNKIDQLLAQMTYEEKVGQMSQRVLYDIDDALIADIKNGKIGSLLITKKADFTPEKRNKLQKIAIEQSRLGIPIIYGHDVIHGFKTIFPLSLAQSCTWDTALVKQAAAVAAKEASAYGIDWTFAPMVDVSRDPRWGRIAECFGEDAWLNGCFGAASIKGYQGNDVSDKDRVVACLKHFVGYGVAMGGRDYQYTDISERSLHEVYLPPFKAGVDAGVLTVMSAFNDINGVPASANNKLLNGVLKAKWKFPGFVVSDWDAVEQLIYHGYAKDSIHAAQRAITAGVDMEMKSGILYHVGPQEIDETVLDKAVRRILYVKFKKGLFENPYTDVNRQHTEILTNEHRALARKVAAQTVVLLENKNHILPIGDKNLTISVVGPFAKERELMGHWRSFGRANDVVTPYSGLLHNAPSGVDVFDKITLSTDIIIACVGESSELFGENHCRDNINLPDGQSAWVAKLKKYKKPIVTIVFNGRPLALGNEKKNSDALLLAWHPGTEAGNALADIIYGKTNPSGKLTTSFPQSVGQIPVYYNYRNSGRPKYNTYLKKKAKPLYPFGYGLSYTNFEYSNLILSAKKISKNGSINIKASILNTGTRDGNEVVQLYIQDITGTTTRPIRELKGFKKVFIPAGKSEIVSFTINAEDLAVLDENMNPKVEAGKFNVWVSASSVGGLQGNFEILGN